MSNNRITSRRPEPTEMESDAQRQLVAALSGECALAILEGQMHWLCELGSSLSTEQIDRIHAPYGWTVRQVFEHCANAERLWGYRIMHLADGSEPVLPDWDENVSADSRFGLGNFCHLITECGDLRKANLSLLRRLVPTAWDCSGTVGRSRVSVLGAAWIIAGHLQHHLEIVENRCQITAERSALMKT